MFEIGSYVVYRAEGVCVVSDVRSESFGAIGCAEDYYILTPMKDEKSTVFVPVNNQKLVSYMRELMTAEQIMETVRSLKDSRVEWAEESRVRSALFRDILAEGDRRELISLLNTIYDRTEELKEQGKKLGSANTAILQRAEKMLYEEFSATTDIESVEDIKSVLRCEKELGARH